MSFYISVDWIEWEFEGNGMKGLICLSLFCPHGLVIKHCPKVFGRCWYSTLGDSWCLSRCRNILQALLASNDSCSTWVSRYPSLLAAKFSVHLGNLFIEFKTIRQYSLFESLCLIYEGPAEIHPNQQFWVVCCCQCSNFSWQDVLKAFHP